MHSERSHTIATIHAGGIGQDYKQKVQIDNRP